jgi:hypothetical protein
MIIISLSNFILSQSSRQACSVQQIERKMMKRVKSASAAEYAMRITSMMRLVLRGRSSIDLYGERQ